MRGSGSGTAWRDRPQALVDGDHPRDWLHEERLPADGRHRRRRRTTSRTSTRSTFAHFLYDNGRPPRFLAKAGCSTSRSSAGSCAAPARSRSTASRPTRPAPCARGRRGPGAASASVVYPEGTLTRDPGLWPMTRQDRRRPDRAGDRRPVIPVAQWGAQEMLAPYGKRPRLFPRKTVHVTAGPPVDLDDLAAASRRAEVLREATDRIMARDHRAARGDPRRAAAGRALRPAHGRAAGDRQPRRPTTTRTDGGPHDASRRARRRVAGARRSPWCSPTPATTSSLWARRAEVVTAIDQRTTRTPTTCRASSCPRRSRATADPAEALLGAEVVVLAVPSQTLRANLTELGAAAARRTRCWSP